MHNCQVLLCGPRGVIALLPLVDVVMVNGHSTLLLNKKENKFNILTVHLHGKAIFLFEQCYFPIGYTTPSDYMERSRAS